MTVACALFFVPLSHSLPLFLSVVLSENAAGRLRDKIKIGIAPLPATWHKLFTFLSSITFRSLGENITKAFLNSSLEFFLALLSCYLYVF